MIQTKQFNDITSETSKIDTQINNFLIENYITKIIDIKYASSNDNRCHSALLIYDTDNLHS